MGRIRLTSRAGLTETSYRHVPAVDGSAGASSTEGQEHLELVRAGARSVLPDRTIVKIGVKEMRATNDLLSAQFRKARTAVADRIENLFGLQDYPNEEHDREFRDLIESVSLSREELAAFVAMPESSIGEVKRLFAGRRKVRT